VDFIQSHLDFLLTHLHSFVFIAFLVEAAGVPFPSRILLLLAATLAGEGRQLIGLVVATTAGSLIGDHVPYLAGAMTGPRILAFYCRITLGSSDCVDKTVGYFRRFGAAAILLSRFSTSVRLFAAALSGCGHISYGKFIAFDFIGTVVYAVAWVSVGYVVGDRAAEFIGRYQATRLLVLLAPAVLAMVIGYRLWRRRRYGPAGAGAIVADSSCAALESSEVVSADGGGAGSAPRRRGGRGTGDRTASEHS
jgi:membrane protein DedA with SNARE-associated domain